MLGSTVSYCEIVEKLGEGGMGVICKARGEHFDRFAALNVPPPDKTGWGDFIRLISRHRLRVNEAPKYAVRQLWGVA